MNMDAVIFWVHFCLLKHSCCINISCFLLLPTLAKSRRWSLGYLWVGRSFFISSDVLVHGRVLDWMKCKGSFQPNPF